MFCRGNWRPFCVAQVKELAAAYRELGDRARIVLISPQPASKTARLAARVDETENYRDRAEPSFLARVLERHGL